MTISHFVFLNKTLNILPNWHQFSYSHFNFNIYNYASIIGLTLTSANTEVRIGNMKIDASLVLIFIFGCHIKFIAIKMYTN